MVVTYSMRIVLTDFVSGVIMRWPCVKYGNKHVFFFEDTPVDACFIKRKSCKIQHDAVTRYLVAQITKPHSKHMLR
jgi:hypothetical protein